MLRGEGCQAAQACRAARHARVRFRLIDFSSIGSRPGGSRELGDPRCPGERAMRVPDV